MTSKFKVGDRVVVTKLMGSDEDFGIKIGDKFRIVGFGKDFGLPRISLPSGNERGMYDDQLALTDKDRVQVVRFILQYERDSTTCFAAFGTEKQLRQRLVELTQMPVLDRDNIKVYDIKRTRTVSLGVKITLK